MPFNSKPIAIKDEGLDKYLNRTRANHNDFGYKEWRNLVDSKVTAADIARAFNVTKQTIWKWIKLDPKLVAEADKRIAEL